MSPQTRGARDANVASGNTAAYDRAPPAARGGVGWSLKDGINGARACGRLSRGRQGTPLDLMINIK
jgi:hypothetical protein